TSKLFFELKYANEDGNWKLVGLHVNIKPAEKAGKVPTEKELKKLALDSFLLFNDAVQTKSFEKFYGKIAKVWQKQTTPKELREIFQSFIDKEINLEPITKLDPAFEGTPAVNQDGFLVMKGSYPSQPSKVFFELKYVNEDESWKLVGIDVNVKPTDEKAGKIGKKKKE